jgi:NAD(P)-dependent dehydrogenase (short-subunit alcohol dehydrogenase family)
VSFDATSTTDDVLSGKDLTGKRILVTGASAGLGVETCRSLAAHGATVVGAARDLDKARAATAPVREVARNGFELVELDLASLASVRKCADALVAAGKPFDVLIANAGVMACPKGVTADGFETQFGTNHLGHFVLLNRLAPLVRSGGRIVCLSSAGHRFADVDLDDPNFTRTPYQEFVAYGRSKTANVLCAVGLDRRLASRGVRACAVHPGVIQTELGRHLSPALIAQMRSAVQSQSTGSAPALGNRMWKTIPQGAATSVWAAVTADADAVGGHYCEDCHVCEINDATDAGPRGVRPYAVDPARAEALWRRSEELVGERFAP